MLQYIYEKCTFYSPDVLYQKGNGELEEAKLARGVELSEDRAKTCSETLPERHRSPLFAA